VDDFSVTFLETEDFNVTKYLEAWMDEIFDRRRKVFRSGNHTRTATINFQQFLKTPPSFTPQADYRRVRTYILQNVLLKSIDSKDLDYTSTEAFTMSATFGADEILPQF
jgi:hypothetical protein